MEEGTQHEPTAWQMLAPVTDLVTPMSVRAAATLKLADFMTEGPVAVGELARQTGSDRDALGRLLSHLVCHNVFSEPSPGVFGLNDLATLLRSDHPGGMQVSLDLDGFGGQMDLAFTSLLHTVRTGEPAWEKVFGTSFWQHLASAPGLSASFDESMTAGAEYVTDDASGYDWSGAEHVVDVGGGTGALLAEILSANPQLRGTLVDLPGTVERGREFLITRGVADSCSFVGQSFFDALPTDGDVYVLNSVLHDWNDDYATAILSRCAEAAGNLGKVIIIEDSGAQEKDQAEFAEMNLRMLVLCGGRERGLEEYSSLAEAAHLRVVHSRHTRLSQIVIECSAAPEGNPWG